MTKKEMVSYLEREQWQAQQARHKSGASKAEKSAAVGDLMRIERELMNVRRAR